MIPESFRPWKMFPATGSSPRMCKARPMPTSQYTTGNTTIDPNNLDVTPETKPVEEDDWINENLQEDEELSEDLRAELYKRIDPFKPELKNLYNVTDQELEILVNAYLNGDFVLPPNTPEWARKLFEFS